MLAVLRNPCKRQVRMSKAKITSCYGMAWWIYNGFIRILTACAKTWTMDWTMDAGRWTMEAGRWTSIVQVLAFVLKPGRWTIFI
jgi:hypothetical protein